jgi:chromosome segregation protein
MKLRKLILHGYKTFASKTEFEFDEGITAIVGPNGSGKSNVADALRWVLGEQSYSTLRGKRTMDMIFAGSQQRARAGMAHVSLTLDNSDGWLPVDYAEVEIGRRAFRSGENEYLLNDQRVRLKDVMELLATSGLSERTYTIIGQGLIDQALSLRSDERRALFEEAAGINHYKTRRAETLRRLEETQRNLARVNDILEEIRPRLSLLKRQAQRARNYEQIAADLRHLLRIWYGYQWEQSKAELRHARQSAAAVESSWRESREKLLARQQEIDTLQQSLNQLQQGVTGRQNARDTLRDQLATVRRNLAVFQERQKAIASQTADLAREIPALEQQQAGAQAELSAATAELTAAQTELEGQQARWQQFHMTFESQQVEIGRHRQELRRVEQQVRSSQNELAQAEGQLRELRERLAGLKEQRRLGAEEQGSGGELTIDNCQLSIVNYEQEAAEWRQKRNGAVAQRQAIANELKPLRQKLREEEQRQNELQNNIARLEERVKLLDQIRSKARPLDEELVAGRLLGQLAGLLNVPDAYAPALSAALSARLATWVVSDTAALWHIWDSRHADYAAVISLADVRNGRPSFTPNDDDLIGRASELVDAQPDVAAVVEQLLGEVWLVKDTAAAYRLARESPPGTLVVTPDGFVAHAGGLVEMHNVKAAPTLQQNGEGEWQAAQQKLDEARQALAAQEEAVGRLQATLEEKQEQADAHHHEERRLGRLESEAEQRVYQAQQQLERLHRQQAEAQRQEAARQQEIERLHGRIGEVEARIVDRRQAIVTLETTVNEARGRLEALPVSEQSQQRATLQQTIAAAQTVMAGRRAVVDSRRATLNQIDRQLGRLRQQLANLNEQENTLVLGEEVAMQARLEGELAELDAAVAGLNGQIEDIRGRLGDLQKETAAIQRHVHELENQMTQARIRLTQSENQIEGLQERIRADLGLVALRYDADQSGPTPLPMHDVVEELPPADQLPANVAEIEEAIQNYRAQLQRMGPINPDAPAEYDTTAERYEFLSQQVEDLRQTDEQLRKVIAELDDLTSRAFAQTVEQVNAVFGDTFQRLFGGGNGRLVLTEPDDLTVTGVEIVARLPNRREQGLGLLSGGERSLTAAALIFSLLKVSPPPFCVLDEVDAALDEANINRFRDFLRELGDKTQFIIITHNRGTIQAAQTVYGISMQSDSASQVLSIRPEEYVGG